MVKGFKLSIESLYCIKDSLIILPVFKQSPLLFIAFEKLLQNCEIKLYNNYILPSSFSGNDGPIVIKLSFIVFKFLVTSEINKGIFFLI